MENKKTGHPINIRFDDETWSDFLRVHHGETLNSPSLKVNKKDLITDIFKLGLRKWHQTK